MTVAMWILAIVFGITVVASFIFAKEYARVDSIHVDFKVEEFKHASGSSVPIEAIRVNSTVEEHKERREERE